MKALKFLLIFPAFLFVISCGPKDNKPLLKLNRDHSKDYTANIPLDKGFSEYIAGYTSGIIPSNSAIEVRFTPEFAAKADKSATGLFVFDPAIKGKTEWKDETTLVFTPSRLLDPGITYTGGLNLEKLAGVQERLKIFPLRLQTLKKDFRVTMGALESASPEGTSYLLHGEIIASDIVEAREVENWLRAKLGRKKLDITWDHADNLVHKFTVPGIDRSGESQELTLSWDGSSSGVNQKGSSIIIIPPSGAFNIIDIITATGENQKIDIIFSDPVEASQEIEGLIQFTPSTETTININSNIISLFPANRLQGKVSLNVESSVRNNKGVSLTSIQPLVR